MEIKWTYNFKGKEVSPRTPVSGVSEVLLAFNHGAVPAGSLISLDLETGKENWRHDTQHYFNTPSIDASGSAYITSFAGDVYKINRSGQVCWSNSNDQSASDGIIADEKYIYAEIGFGADLTRALSLEDGRILWEYNNGGHSYSLEVCGNHVVHTTQTGGRDRRFFVHCLDTSGGIAWKKEHPHFLFAPLIHGGLIYVGSRGYIAVFRLDDGALTNQFFIDEGDAVIMKPILRSSEILFVTEKSKLYSIQSDDPGACLELYAEFPTSEILCVACEEQKHIVLTDSGLNMVSRTSGIEEVVTFKGGEGGLMKVGQDLIIASLKTVQRVCIKN